MFKICVIGCGTMSSTGHGPAFAKYKKDYQDVVLAGCCDLDIQKAQDYMQAYGFEACYTDYTKMIEEIRPDVVSVITPVDFTCDVAIDVMKKGCNIILEKPPGKNIEEIRRMQAVAKEYGVSVRTSFNRRYTPLILELMRRVKASGETIISITYQMYRYNRFEPDFSTTAIHAIDVVKHIVGCDYQSVNLSYDHHPELGEGVKNVFLNGHFENGTHFQITLVPTGGAVTERLTVNTLGQSFFVDLPVWDNIDVPGKLLQVSQGNQCQVVTGDMLSDSIEMFDICGFYNENRLYFESLREGKSINDLESAIQSVELEDVVRRSLPHYAK
ncbi:MAG: Gfo/Idh/MocA family oxidoreductase [Clostridia bacterium]|nr:Gfo/Idh/MocA family oxidoreductase [Oscillospiraceae bacterium]MBQ4623814.1 Gfo/Idh/MocA family oxidoreductase [Clostridia bacterium]